ncbi:hypothetical protein BGZ95_000702 [Linnemannia exigua]|uniref:FAD-binding domain-containing protein n=1 Tax=Linnemannia exigua TaxID=604196 RepID=A0AAD4H5G3_9FUNG|nr:hypothetical protein BGZ95_000702 [Linnemannia exigua]
MEINPAVTFKHDRSVMYAKRPKVLIVGGGIGGLTLGAILQKSDTPFEIFERTPEVKPLGSITSLTGAAAPLLKQLGIWDEFYALTRELAKVQVVVAPDLETQFVVSAPDDAIERYGAESRVLPRPKLHELLLRQIPKEHVHLGKKILSTQQGGNGVLIRCSDGTEYEGDILVGSDGAYSAVRQNLYAQLKKENRLPASDGLPLPFLNVCLVGQTRKLTLEEFPDLAKTESQFKNILSKDKPYAWATFTTEQMTICYAVTQYLTAETSKDNDSFRNSEWGPEAAQAMCNEVRDFPIVSGRKEQLTMGDLFDWTPKECISKVMLEEKVFKTWSDTRTVLMGDACHKVTPEFMSTKFGLNPSGGSGAVNAIHDAIVLANYIHALPDHPIAEEIEAAFVAYRKERIDHVEHAFTASQAFRNMVDSGWKAKLMRYLAKSMPSWVSVALEKKVMTNRPQLYFLPRDTTPAELPAAPQPSLHLKRPESRKKNEDVVAVAEVAAVEVV